MNHTFEAWSCHDVTLERYRYPPGRAEALPLHVHETYRFCLSLDFPGRYDYRRARHAVPVGSLSIIHPGEPHAASDPCDREHSSTFLTLYVPLAVMLHLGSEDKAATEPFFRDPIVLDTSLFDAFLAVHRSAEEGATRLEQDCRLYRALGQALKRYAGAPFPEPKRERAAVRRVRAYLQEGLSQDISLAGLAGVARLSKPHLLSVFQQEVGMSPYRYLTALRIERAKALLQTGLSISETALAVGYADQSHLHRHFRRIVRMTPGAFQRGFAVNPNNVQDGARSMR